MALFDVLLAWLVSVVGVATGAAYVPDLEAQELG